MDQWKDGKPEEYAWISCLTHGPTFSINPKTGKRDHSGICMQCAEEIKSGTVTECGTHGLQPRAEGVKGCVLCFVMAQKARTPESQPGAAA